MSWEEIRKLYFEEETEQCYLETVRRIPVAIRLIENPSEEVCLSAVRARGDYIRYIKNPSEEVCLISICNAYCDGFKYIENPSEKVCLEVIDRHPEMILIMKNPTVEMCKKALYQSPGLADRLELSDEILRELLPTNPKLITKMKNPSLEDYLKVYAVVELDSSCLYEKLLVYLVRYIKGLSEEDSLGFIAINPSLIGIIEQPTIRQVYQALKVDPTRLGCIVFPTRAEEIPPANLPGGDSEI